MAPTENRRTVRGTLADGTTQTYTLVDQLNASGDVQFSWRTDGTINGALINDDDIVPLDGA